MGMFVGCVIGLIDGYYILGVTIYVVIPQVENHGRLVSKREHNYFLAMTSDGIIL